MRKKDELTATIAKSLNDARTICDLCEKEKRDFTAEERTNIEQLLTAAKGAKDELKRLKADEDLVKEIAALGGESFGISSDSSKQVLDQKARNVPLTIGEQFVSAESWMKWFNQIAPNGTIPDNYKGINSPTVRVETRKKALITGASNTSAGAFIAPQDSGIYEAIGRWVLSIRNLIDLRETTRDAVEFVRQTAQLTQSAPTQESNVTTYSGGTGEISGEKTEGTMTFERVQTPVKTIAVWIPATKRALSDVAQLRGIIDSELTDDLAEEEENQILNGNGLGENFTGLNNTAGVLVQNWLTNILITTRRAVTTLLVTGRTIPTAWVFNPLDWEIFDLLTDDQGRYYWGGPQRTGIPMLWGVPVVQSFLQTQGTGWLGNWKKAVIWDKEMTTISASDSHADFFIRNMVAILAEKREAFGVIRPSGFIQVTLTDGS